MSKKEKNTEIKETEAVAEEKAPKEKKNLKKLKFGSMSAIVIALVIAIVVILNVMCSVLMKRYPVKLDLTPDNRYEISDQSIEVLKNMDKDVEITVTTTKDYFTQLGNYYKNMYYQSYGVIVDCPFEIIPEMLEKYSVYAEQGKGSVSVRYVDINKNPDVVTDLKQNYNGEISDGSIVFRCGDRVKVIEQNDVMSMITPSQASSSTNIMMTFAGESKLTSAIKSVTDMNPVRAAIITSVNGGAIIGGQDPHYYITPAVEEFLSDNGYDCTEVDAGEELSPADYDLLVLVAPSIDFSQDIVAKFTDFLYNNGEYQRNMLYLPNLYATNLTNIDEFLQEWKIGIDSKVVIDEENSAQVAITALQSISMAPILEISDTEALKLTNDKLPVVAPFARPINILSVNNDSTATELLRSKTTSTAQDLISDNAQAEQGSFSIAVKSCKEVAVGLSVNRSNLLVMGSPFMFDTTIIDNTNTFNNASAVLSVLNDMTGKEAGEVIRDKSIQSSTLSLTSKSVGIIQIIVIIAIPALIAIAGISVLIWRKNK